MGLRFILNKWNIVIIDDPPFTFSMRIGVWNIRGKNKEYKQREVVDCFKHNKFDLMGINETRVRVSKFNFISRRGFRYFNIFHNYSNHSNGRLWVIWNKALLIVTPFCIGDQWVHLQVQAPGCPLYQTLIVLWELGKGLVILVLICKQYKGLMRPSVWLALRFCLLMVVITLGLISRIREIKKWMKLDRVLVNSGWHTEFSSSYAESLVAGVSDHSPLVVQIQASKVSRLKQFRYLNCWGQDPQFAKLVKEFWAGDIRGCSMYKFVSHLKQIKGRLRQLHMGSYSSISERAELSSTYQRAKAFEVKMGDANTSYFFAKMGARRSNVISVKLRVSLSIIKGEFIKAISDFFRTGKLLKEVKSTIISLITKVYKTISNILTNRLKKVMPDLVWLEQAAFVQEISIVDNTILAHKLVSGYGRKNSSTRCVIKVDIKKAFDSVLTLHNWSSVGYFEGNKGLRQGDPLSPLFFVICIEILSQILRRLPDHPNFRYNPKCCRIGSSHLIFADDLLVFTRGDYLSMKAVERCLLKFSEYSGLTPNPAKTNIFWRCASGCQRDDS
ncbi:uncharacterized protein LOC141588140 [Silene latifolia]|uniref:uncharacterized protein LOC141588140 n=1 Tax=Silene latifolia TaxID=37657 RepID=UPI003D76BF68